jgi:hypothetical protein
LAKQTLAGEFARAPAVHHWSHGYLAVSFCFCSSRRQTAGVSGVTAAATFKPKPFDQLKVCGKLQAVVLTHRK